MKPPSGFLVRRPEDDRPSRCWPVIPALLITLLPILEAQLPPRPPGPMPPVGEEVHYRGAEVVLSGQETNFGPGAIIQFDFDGDGVFDSRCQADEDGFFVISLDVSDLAPPVQILVQSLSSDESERSPITQLNLVQDSQEDLSSNVPRNLVPGEFEPAICSCIDCPAGATAGGSSLDLFTNSYTPTEYNTELATGKLRKSFPITSFQTHLLGFDFHLHYASLVEYDGYLGQGFSHSFNMMIVRTEPLAGQIITPDLRIYPIASEDGLNWELPEGFYSRLTLDPRLKRWELTHFSGLEVSFYLGATGHPGYPISITEPNGNTTTFQYDNSGLLQTITTDLDQVQNLTYYPDDPDVLPTLRGRLQSFADHLGHTWTITAYDEEGRILRYEGPGTDYVDIGTAIEVTDTLLPALLVRQPRATTFTYAPRGFLDSVTDERGATPYAWSFDPDGRVSGFQFNGKPGAFDIGPIADPAPLPVLEPENMVVRVIDREGNQTDYEIHSIFGGPAGGLGKFGMRRKVTWTRTGEGAVPLRNDEPLYWEQRWLQDCDCLAPRSVTEPFSNVDQAGFTFGGTIFDILAAIPNNWPRTIYEYNDRRQVTRSEYTDGDESIITTYSYSIFDAYSRLLTRTEPRAFDTNPLYAGLDFTHFYDYDERGNQTRHDAPVVTRGVEDPQVISETWAYNEFGQPVRHVDANGNVTSYSYFTGPSTGGDINTKGGFGGYRESEKHGAAGSVDPAPDLTTRYRVNALGMTTQRIDPKGFVYDYEYNDLAELTREIEPAVTVRNDEQVRYETRYIYDGAGNQAMTRRSNIDLDGSVPTNGFIDRSTSYDAINNQLSSRVEVNEQDNDDLITRYAYDRNDQLAVVQKPEGNRTFHIYDERRLLYKTFYGISRPTGLDSPAESYDGPKPRTVLDGPTFVGLQIYTYDARRNSVRTRDGRGNFVDDFFDFYNRRIATSDQNGNGMTYEYDDASNVLTTEGGAVDKAAGVITEVFERTYQRYDEIGRSYQRALDIDLTTGERTAVDPDDGQNSSYPTRFDPGSRVVTEFDAEGNPTSYDYDAADRRFSVTDALDNVRTTTYDRNSNVISITETERPGPGAEGQDEEYVLRYEYDSLDRLVDIHIHGLNGDSIDHYTFYSYDSRHNRRLVQDSEDNFTLSGYDHADRLLRTRRFDRDPFDEGSRELQRYDHGYDRNSRKIEDCAFSDVRDPESGQRTRYAYDDLDRLIRTVYPDSDDPIDGRADGPDGLYDRVETIYDPNSNAIHVKEQREVVVSNTYDPGNRLIRQDFDIAGTSAAPGSTTRQQYLYDSLNRLTHAANNFALAKRQYDPLSRLAGETQSIQLDGSGAIIVAGNNNYVSDNFAEPIEVASGYDRQSNRTSLEVVNGTNTDLGVTTTYDALNRTQGINAAYFDVPDHPIADYAYLGPWRVQSKTYGNGAALTNTYDVKRRIASHIWRDESGGTLVGFQYDYDRMDNVLFERFEHDTDPFARPRTDWFEYNDRYEIVGAEYRSAAATAPAVSSTAFHYDDTYNRRVASYGDPFGNAPNAVESYEINDANEYTQIRRHSKISPFRSRAGRRGTSPPTIPANPAHDRAGNMTRFPVGRTTGSSAEPFLHAAARWDAFNCLFDIQVEDRLQQHYRYDAFRRRIAKLELTRDGITSGSRRYVYDDWSVVEERLFNMSATLSSSPATLERIYVHGSFIDEPLLAALDSDLDDILDHESNIKPINNDAEYYYLDNHLGSVMGLVSANDSERILEYYRYQVYGKPTALPVVDDNTDDVEDTPLSLSDNNIVKDRQFSRFGNPYLFGARRLDTETGLYYYRARYLNTVMGSFVQRDPLELWTYIGNLGNSYSYVLSRPTAMVDPYGLQGSRPQEQPSKSCLHCEIKDWRNRAPQFPEFPYSLSGFPSAEYNRKLDVCNSFVSDFMGKWKEKLLCVIKCLGNNDVAKHLEGRGFRPFFYTAGLTLPETTNLNPRLLRNDRYIAVQTYLHESIHSFVPVLFHGKKFQTVMSAYQGQMDQRVTGCCCEGQEKNTWRRVREPVSECMPGEYQTNSAVEKCCCECEYVTSQIRGLGAPGRSYPAPGQYVPWLEEWTPESGPWARF